MHSTYLFLRVAADVVHTARAAVTCAYYGDNTTAAAAAATRTDDASERDKGSAPAATGSCVDR